MPGRPANAEWLLVLAHGAGAGFNHAHMCSLAAALEAVGVATLRFNFPFIEAGRRRVDAQADSMAVISAAFATAQDIDLRVAVGGHSYGGRMASHAVVEHGLKPESLVYFSFPLHPAKKPGVQRAAHLTDVCVPQLFVSGTRDTLAEQELLADVVSKLPDNAMIHWLQGADHSFKSRKRDRIDMNDVYDEAAEAVVSFLQRM